MKEWEHYEEQIFKKLNELFPDSEILKNQKIRGKFSKRIRQVDILVTASLIGSKILVVVDCKKFSNKVNVKTVESFLGFTEDIGAHVGIIITNEGFSKSAERRVENYHRDIKLEIIEYVNLDSYHIHWDICEGCRNSEVPKLSEISWSKPELLEWKGLYQLIQLGHCHYCGTPHIKCQGCGGIIEVDDFDFTNCMCGLAFGVNSPKPGEEISIFDIVIKEVEDGYDEKVFVDPNQIKLWK